MIFVHFQGKPFYITVIQVYALTSNAEEAEAERFLKTHRPSRTHTSKRCPFQHRGLKCNIGSQEMPRKTGKFGLEVQNEAGQRLTEFCQEKILVLENPLPTTQETLHMDITRWSIPKSN